MDPKNFYRKVAIAGVAESDIGRVPHKSKFQLSAEASRKTLDEAGLCNVALICHGSTNISDRGGRAGPGSGQRTEPGGEFPRNPQGSALSFTHPGMFGIFAVIEAVRQLRGECGSQQVPDAAGTIILRRE